MVKLLYLLYVDRFTDLFHPLLGPFSKPGANLLGPLVDMWRLGLGWEHEETVGGEWIIFDNQVGSRVLVETRNALHQ